MGETKTSKLGKSTDCFLDEMEHWPLMSQESVLFCYNSCIVTTVLEILKETFPRLRFYSDSSWFIDL